ncbi:MAG: diguanylate cyclase [Blautia sp.]
MEVIFHLREYGNVYRIGGDEFVVIVTKNTEQFEKVLRTFDQRVEKWHGKLVDSMTVSYGHVFNSEKKWNSVYDIAKAAEKRMYESKAHFYHKRENDNWLPDFAKKDVPR